MDAGMDAAQLRALCDTFALGTPLGQPQTVTGGLLHRMWRLATERGDFAIKELSRGYLHHPESVEIFASTERIAARMAAAGIPALAALETPTGPLLTLGEAAFLVYPWVDGQLLPPGPVEPSVARMIGALLGRIHRLNLTDKEGEASAGEIHVLRDDEWVLLARRGEAARLPWAAGLRELQTSLVLWNARYRRVLGDLLKTAVISHRDLDQKNVLWRGPDDPVLVDWESAGAINPAVELAGVALDWSGLAIGEPNPDAFRAVIAGYRDAGATIHDAPRDALYANLARWMPWLKFSISRSLGDEGGGASEQDLGTEEAVNTLAVLERLASGVDLYASWLGGAVGDD